MSLQPVPPGRGWAPGAGPGFGPEQSWTVPQGAATAPGELRASASKQGLAKSRDTTLLAAWQREMGICES